MIEHLCYVCAPHKKAGHDLDEDFHLGLTAVCSSTVNSCLHITIMWAYLFVCSILGPAHIIMLPLMSSAAFEHKPFFCALLIDSECMLQTKGHGAGENSKDASPWGERSHSWWADSVSLTPLLGTFLVGNQWLVAPSSPRHNWAQAAIKQVRGLARLDFQSSD